MLDFWKHVLVMDQIRRLNLRFKALSWATNSKILLKNLVKALNGGDKAGFLASVSSPLRGNHFLVWNKARMSECQDFFHQL